ncbi:E3 ubiquitin-protein ligase ariadne-1-like [Drosophila kikkawai]|uniref:RBR-type E3 ubiquitin transferase n=1 Tax=Drosophila kikkawai TaxID=30033 RepID=A0A6P4HQU6_DROKI|nr:E3 ubiquitin-protein ligase ariadne-1-like [Drosophila kikkawai]XP_017018317.1 E3 ubiquitin-protein ligase ariadne-1-like [Drosophila kikkawai]
MSSNDKTEASPSFIGNESPSQPIAGNWDSEEETDIVSPETPCQHVEPDDFVYKVLSVYQIVQHQRDIIDEVNNVLNLSPPVARTILNHFNWDKERLLENYFESTPHEFFQRAQVLNPFEIDIPSPPEAYNPSLDDLACEICFCSDLEHFGLGCGHNYCVECWKQYLVNKTCSEGLTHTITCPAANCNILVDYATYLALVDDLKVVERYKQLTANTFVKCNTLMRWCPAPNCSYVIEANYMGPKAVECKCGHQFCFSCGENWHEPVACNLLKNWLSIIEDPETTNWIYHNTKKCPQCQVSIQKFGGCEHMVCRNLSCLYQFCWLCLQPWRWHSLDWFRCRLFAEAAERRARLEQENSSDTRVRVQYYKDCYISHMQSMKKERKLYAEIQAKINDKELGIRWIEVQFLRDAIDAMCQCRSILMYSYVFAFYLKNNNQKEIFEYNQKDLETATDRISECLQQEITVENLYDIKKKVIELSQYCQQRRHVLLSYVREGNEKGWWDCKEATLPSPF